MYTHTLHFPVFEPLLFGPPPHHLSFPCPHHLILAVAPVRSPPGCAEDEAAAQAPLILVEMLEGHQEAVIQHVELPEEGGVQFHLAEEPAPLGPCWSISTPS